jgi:hypothetical protein
VKFLTDTSYVGTPLPALAAGLALVEVDGVVADDAPLSGLDEALLLQPATNNASARQVRRGRRRTPERRTPRFR